MRKSKSYSTYQNTMVKTASPASLIVLLYEGAIKNIRKGERLLQSEEDFHEAAIHLMRAISIVSELMGILNPNVSSDLSTNLAAIYTHVVELINGALQDRDPASLPKAVEIMSSLGSAWSEVAQKSTKQAV